MATAKYEHTPAARGKHKPRRKSRPFKRPQRRRITAEAAAAVRRFRQFHGRLIRDIVSTGDLLGFSPAVYCPTMSERIEGGSAFMFITLSPDTFRMLAEHGAEMADLEPDDEGGGDVEDEGEDSLGWSAGSQDRLESGYGDREGEHDGREPDPHEGDGDEDREPERVSIVGGQGL